APHPLKDTIRSCADLLRLLPARTAVRPQVPVRSMFPDLGRGQALVLAVVPFAQVLGHVRPVSEPGQLAGLASPPQRTRHDERKVPLGEFRTQGRRAFPADLEQRQIGAAGVLAAEAPFGLAVTN